MSLREYVDKLRDSGKEYVFLGKLGREYEVTRHAYQVRNRIVEFELEDTGIHCITNLISNRKDLYTILGVNNDVEAYEKIIDAIANPVKLEKVDFNEYFEETSYTLEDMPFIKYFREDGGYYLTGSIIVACIDNICNASFHRIMYVNENEAVVRIVPRHLHQIYQSYREKGEDTPVAIVLGADPIVELASAITTRYGLFELEIAARLSGDNRVALTPKYKIPVPVTTSIVLEGVISRDKLVEEGPFVDILGLADIKRKQPVFQLEKIHVNKKYPILYHAIVPSLWDHIFLMGFPREAMIYNVVKTVSPNIKSVRLTIGSGGWLHAIVSLKQVKPGEARNVGMAVVTAHPSVKHVIVVDDDIDVDDPYMVEWAIATRVRGGEDIIIIRNTHGSTLDPRSRDGVGDKVIIDATKPFDEPWDKYKRVKIP